MRLKRFLIGLSLAIAIAAPPVVFSCVYPDDSGYFSSPFIVDKGGLLEEKEDRPGFEETLDFWSDYTKGNVPRQDIRKFFNDVSESNSLDDGANNPFYRYLVNNNDETALKYIRKCLELGALIEEYRSELWDYDKPSPEGIQQFIASLNKVSTSEVFKLRYELLKMRAYSAIRDNKGVMDVWKKNEKKNMTAALRDRFEGYVAGVLYREGKYEEALDYYCRLGDTNSISWCIDKLAGSANLAKLYDHDPNSPAIPYILEDFINYLIAATQAGRVSDSQDDYTVYDDEMRDLRGEPTYDVSADREDMIALSRRVLEDGKTQNPMMWATAMGVMQGIGKDYAESLATLRQAKGMKGTPQAELNLRNFTLWALLLNSGRGNEALDAEFAREMGSYYNSVVADANKEIRNYSKENRKIRREYEYPTIQEFEFFTNFFAREGLAHYQETGNNRRAMAFLAMLDDLPALKYGDGFLVELRDMMDQSGSDKNCKDFLAYLNIKNPGNELDRLYVPYARKYENLANDVMGTRLMREGRFPEALNFLSQVDPKWIRTQAIAPYLESYYISPDYYNFQRHARYDREDLSRTNNNYKAEFCGDFIDAMDEYETLSGDEKARKAIELAAMCHYATPRGNGWALADYTWSSTREENEFTKMAKEWLDKALRYAQTDATKMTAYFGILSLPSGNKEGDTTYAFGQTYDYDLKQPFYYIDSPTSQQREALSFISDHWYVDDKPYTLSSCDVLKSYMAGNFISKPTHSWSW